MLKAITKAPIRLYQLCISPWLAPSCRYSPTCSDYTLQAIEKHGAFTGTFLGIGRILRCNPWNKCTHHDPVPESIDWPRRIRYKR